MAVVFTSVIAYESHHRGFCIRNMCSLSGANEHHCGGTMSILDLKRWYPVLSARRPSLLPSFYFVLRGDYCMRKLIHTQGLPLRRKHTKNYAFDFTAFQNILSRFNPSTFESFCIAAKRILQCSRRLPRLSLTRSSVNAVILRYGALLRIQSQNIP